MPLQGPLRLGTRGSALALAQTEELRRRLADACPALAVPGALETVVVRTTGDRVQDRPLSEIGGKGLFARELEQALLDRRIDVAVHSLKDLPSVLGELFRLSAVLERADPRDALVTREGLADFTLLPEGAVLGSSSLRRQAMALALRPDLKVRPLRGNVDTRLRKLDAGDYDALLLAQAGLDRLGLGTRGRAQPVERLLPAVAQGAIGLEIRAEDTATAALLAPVNHRPSWRAVTAERACLAALRGSCVTPVGVLAEIAGEAARLRACLILPDGSEPLAVEHRGSSEELPALAEDAGQELRRRAGPAHLALLES
jgi:hydroxymethylbilane synthase